MQGTRMQGVLRPFCRRNLARILVDLPSRRNLLAAVNSEWALLLLLLLLLLSSSSCNNLIEVI